MLNKENSEDLNHNIKLQIKAEKIRENIIKSIYYAGSGHPGGSLSIAEILSILYFDHMQIDKDKPDWANRDRLILSKGHAAPALYAALAQKGYFSEPLLRTLRKNDSILQGHPDMNKIPGIDMSTGSLGQGLSAANGMALYAKYSNLGFRVYVIVGDGEIQEGQIWEAAMTSSHHKLNNVTVIVDNNNLQIDGQVNQIKSIYPIKEKFEAFNWRVLEVNGHQIQEIKSALELAKSSRDKPVCIIAKTIKGKGVCFMEDQADWHGKAPDEQEYLIAIKEIQQRIERLETQL